LGKITSANLPKDLSNRSDSATSPIFRQLAVALTGTTGRVIVAAMAPHPRPDESRAAELVQATVGMSGFRYADRPNGVDYVGARGGRGVALEVTRFTSQERRREPPVAIGDAVPLETKHSWLLFLGAPPQRDGLRERLEPALQELERHRIRDYHASLMGWWLSNVPTLREALAALATDQVVGAQVVELRPARLFLAPARKDGHPAPEEALQLVESYLAEEAHHLRKTAAAPQPERHLFVWVDGATPQRCAAAFLGDSPPPDRDPVLPEGIGHLWVVHEQTGRGWHWQRRGEARHTLRPDGWTALGSASGSAPVGTSPGD
jgi:hypothetical protein